MALINQPPTGTVDVLTVDANGKPTLLAPSSEWLTFFNAAYQVCNAASMSGTTVNRPTKLLWTGRPYFDTTIGKPIWYKTVGWVDATGAGV